jgi:hypothetical protein
MSDTQKAYAYDDPDAPSALVPQALTAYRHFAVREEDQQVFPMNQYGYVSNSMVGSILGFDTSCYRIEGVHTPEVDAAYEYDINTGSVSRSWGSRPPLIPGCDCSLCREIEAENRYKNSFLRPSPPRRQVPDSRPAEVYTAKCGRSKNSGLTFQYFYPGKEQEDHVSPGDGCSCGFYAHYAPTEDFYDGSKWYPGETMTLVRTVVELTGRVIMGTKGVRAERMKMLAMAVDWDKMAGYRKDPIEYDVTSFNGWRMTIPEKNFYRTGEMTAFQNRTQLAVEATARLYGVKYYDDPEVMYKDYPQPDISHLLPEQGDKDDEE